MIESSQPPTILSPNDESHVDTPLLHPTLRVLLVTSLVSLVCVTLTFYAAVMANQPPVSFNSETRVHIASGESVATIADTLARQNIIRSPLLFTFLVVVSGSSEILKAGTYRFIEPPTTVEVVHSLVTGTRAETDIIVTIPEGTRATAIAEIIADSHPTIDKVALESALVPLEGYLFPETYHLAPDSTIQDITTLLTNTFTQRMPRLEPDSERSVNDIVTMASILEREGKSSESMGLISGILWKRLEIDMPLQVDATLEYERGKGSAELTFEDLEEDSLYNTYTRRGLPPTPIANPGMVALLAALEPTPSPYLYYLTDNEGVFHYARTFEEHKENKALHLR